MGSGGTEWETNDIFDPTRMNQKTLFVGSSTQISTFVTSPNVGQCVFSLNTSGSYQANKKYYRNSANDAWLANEIDDTSYSSTQSDNSIGITVENVRHYALLTLPSTYKFYIITSISGSFSTGAFTTALCHMGIDLFNADPPTSSHYPLIGISQSISVSAGAAKSTYNRKCSSKIIPAGTVIGIWLNMVRTGPNSIHFYSEAIGTPRYTITEVFTETPGTAISSAITTTTGTPFYILYATGFN
jgi:hypothetical protein